MSSLIERIKKQSRTEQSSVLTDSKLFDSELVSTPVPMLNVALSGDIDGGLGAGLHTIAGPSKHFKTSFMLLIAAAYMKKYPDAVMLFYDSEFGSPQAYFQTFGIDTDRVFHTPITDVEKLKLDLVSQLENLERTDKVIVCIDSIGNTASKKELDDALDGKSVTDMSRAKALKGLFRMVTPYLTMKDIPLIAVNHTYDSMDKYSGPVVSGGTGIYYSSNTIWVVGRRQNKKDSVLLGYDFVVNVEKSRYVKEKSKIPISVSFDGGIEPYSGLMEVALAGGYVSKPKIGWYARIDKETGEVLSKNYRMKETLSAEFWDPVLNETDFKEFVRSHFTLGYRSMLGEGTDVTEQEVDDTPSDTPAED